MMHVWKSSTWPWSVDDNFSLLGVLGLNIPLLSLSSVPFCIAGATATATLANSFTCEYAPVCVRVQVSECLWASGCQLGKHHQNVSKSVTRLTWNLFTEDIQILYCMLFISKYYVHYVCMYSFTRDSSVFLLLLCVLSKEKKSDRKITVQMALISHWILGIVRCLQIWIVIYFVSVYNCFLVYIFFAQLMYEKLYCNFWNQWLIKESMIEVLIV